MGAGPDASLPSQQILTRLSARRELRKPRGTRRPAGIWTCAMGVAACGMRCSKPQRM